MSDSDSLKTKIKKILSSDINTDYKPIKKFISDIQNILEEYTNKKLHLACSDVYDWQVGHQFKISIRTDYNLNLISFSVRSRINNPINGLYPIKMEYLSDYVYAQNADELPSTFLELLKTSSQLRQLLSCLAEI